MVLQLASLVMGVLDSLKNLASGFAFGTGYGAGVRFGFEDVYPYFSGKANEVIDFFFPNSFSQSGFQQASGLTQNQQSYGLNTIYSLYE